MCFGSRGDPAKKDKGHFSQARRTAERAMERPYFITIGGGEQVPDELDGRVVELVRATGVFGETIAFVRDDELRLRLSQWPVAIVVSEVYSVDGEPRLVEDLGFPDRRILANAYDSVIRDEEQIHRLWEALKDRQITRRWEVKLPPGFHDPGKVQMFGTHYPTLTSSSKEGKRLWMLSLKAERDPVLRRHVMVLNRSQHGGVIVCEACGFADDKDAMFDAHHLRPLAVGERKSRPDDLAVLCPTCHRWAHAKAEDKLSPVPVEEISNQRS
ncbi:MAG: HNH endonuclease [Alphaproteobacteria bacterium]|nr:HNH endonuclease [Alphaproteobacteria bacterium]